MSITISIFAISEKAIISNNYECKDTNKKWHGEKKLRLFYFVDHFRKDGLADIIDNMVEERGERTKSTNSDIFGIFRPFASFVSPKTLISD